VVGAEQRRQVRMVAKEGQDVFALTEACLAGQ